MPPLKWILCAIGIFNMSSAINYLYYDSSDDETCRVQASMLQFFETGSTLYAVVMALETNILIGIITNSLERLRYTMDSNKTLRRHFAYHGTIAMYGALTVLWINVTDNYGENGTWCWIKKASYRIYLYYIPTWCSILAIMYLDIEVFRVVLKSYQQLRTTSVPMDTTEPNAQSPEESNHSSTNQSPSTARYRVMHPQVLRVLIRMTLYPLCLLVLILPGSVVRIIQAGDYDVNETVFRVLSIARNMCDPSFGTINVIMWIFSDKEVLLEWEQILAKILHRSCIYCMFDIKLDSSGDDIKKSLVESASQKKSTTTENSPLYSSGSSELREQLLHEPNTSSTNFSSSCVPYISTVESTAMIDSSYISRHLNDSEFLSSPIDQNENCEFPEIIWNDP